MIPVFPNIPFLNQAMYKMVEHFGKKHLNFATLFDSASDLTLDDFEEEEDAKIFEYWRSQGNWIVCKPWSVDALTTPDRKFLPCPIRPAEGRNRGMGIAMPPGPSLQWTERRHRAFAKAVQEMSGLLLIIQTRITHGAGVDTSTVRQHQRPHLYNNIHWFLTQARLTIGPTFLGRK